ncbi:MAG: YciI family protein [Wenzhouxiangella sp.]
MFYMILGREADNALPMRQQARPAHVERLKALSEQGRLMLAGPLPAIDAADPGPAGFSGSLMVAEFDSLEAARAWAAEEPYLQAGAWLDVDVRPFVKVLP